MTRAADVRDLRLALADPVDLCGKLGLLDGRPGRDYLRQLRGVTVRCVWHDERTPSMSVTRGPDGTARARCFGCDATGDALAMVAAVARLDVRHEFHEVCARAMELAGASAPAWATPTPYLADAPALDGPTFAAVAASLLARCPVAGDREVGAYLAARGLAAVAPEWGALPADYGSRRALAAALAAEFGDAAWQASGLAVRGGERAGLLVWGGHRLVIPWRGPDGAATTLQRRLIRAPVESEPKYVFATGRQPVYPYGLDVALAESHNAPVAFAEGALDAAALRLLTVAAGAPWAVVGLPGVAGWRASWAALAEGRAAFVALDADAAGDAAAETLATDLHLAGAREVRRKRPKGAKDWAELLAREAA